MRLSVVQLCPGYLLLCCLCTHIQAQPDSRDSLHPPGAYYNALQLYHQYVTPETGLYRGSEYVQYGYTLKEGHPFFDDGHQQQGTIFYNGILFENLMILYDQVREQVVINDAYENYKLFLINAQIDYFTIQHHFFTNLRDNLNPSAPSPGFYEQLFTDRITLLKKEHKTVQTDLSSGKVEGYIVYSVSYYLKKGAIYYPVNNKRSLWQAMGDKRSEAKKFIRKNRLNIHDDKEKMLLQVAAWYNGELSGSANK